MECENCGSNAVVSKQIEGYTVSECQVCFHLHGDEEAMNQIHEIREAREKSIDPQIYPIYKVMEGISTFRIQFASPGYPQEKMPPYFSFRVIQESLKHLERFTEAVREANKRTKIHWVVEANFQKELTFTLKPNFQHDPYNISAEQISLAQRDLAVLAEILHSFF